MTDQILQTRKNTDRAKASTPRYVLLWEKIQQLEAKLLNQESMHKTIIRQFSKRVRPLEENVTVELIGLTKDIMRIFHDSEDNASRSLLGFWVLDNFKTLAAHPFANETEVQELYDHWRLPIQGTDDMVEAQLSLLMASRDDLPGQEKIRSNYPDADMFATKPAATKSKASASFEDEESYSANNEYLNAEEDEDVMQDTSFKKETISGSSGAHSKNKPTRRRSKEDFDTLFDIDKLFRRIAKTVHPDREQDEEKKAQKHAIMSDCLEARDNNDIAGLLLLYAKHVGELPKTWSDESSGELVRALENQLHDLENRASRLHTHDPLLQLILDRYLGHDTNDVERRISAHEENLTEKLKGIQQQRMNLKTEEGFIDALAERRDIELDRLTLSNLTS